MVYRENLHLAQALEEKEQIVEVMGVGNSMTPILKSKQSVMVSSFAKDIKSVRRGDIVFCKVNGYFYLHLVHGIKDKQYLIGNNHGHMNGWTNKVYGKVVEILRMAH
jgi:hypothetical protein